MRNPYIAGVHDVTAILGAMPRRARGLDDRAPGYAGTLTAGTSGTTRRDDYEHNPDLLPVRARIRRLRKVPRSHPVAAHAVDTHQTLIASHHVEVVVDEGQSEEAGEALQALYGIGNEYDDAPLCGMAWHDIVAHKTMAPIQDGASALAVGYGEVDDDTGLTPALLEPRRMANVWEYHTTDRGELTAVELRADAIHNTNSVMMPRYDEDGRVRLIWGAWRGGTNLAYGEGLEGLPIMRSVLGDAEDGLDLRQMRRVAANRFAVGMPHVQVDFEKVGQEFFGSEWMAKPADEKRQFFNTYTTTINNHFGYIANAPNGAAITGIHTDVKMLGNGQLFDPGKFDAPINSTDRAVAERFWTAWLQQGRAGSGGSRSMVGTQADMMFRAVAGYVEWVIGVLRRQLHPTFWRINFPGLPVAERPSIRVSGIQTPEFIKHAEALQGYLDRLGVAMPADGVKKVFGGFGLPAPEAGDVPTSADMRATAAGGSLRTPGGFARARGEG